MRAALGLFAAALLAALAGCARGEAELVGALPLPTLPGGYSGIELAADGAEVVLLSDRGLIVRGVLERQGGRPTGFTETSRQRITGADGAPLPQRQRDSEGLAMAGDGTLFLSFEGRGRVVRFDGALTELPAPPPQPNALLNESYEALALDAAGQLYTLPERTGNGTEDWTLLRLDGAAWAAAFPIPRRGAFVPVGADFGPDGRFYLLERDFTGIAFRSRIRRFEPDGSGETQVLRTGAGTHGNLEGLSVWTGPDGALRLTMVSDNNESALLRGEIVEYRLAD
ncbi:esterase-like activity of phytase family protein [Pseudoroseicyclus sp. CXY001]|uniref:esterase-like activity of phytase family protein n=1 Tax=Pseudoroseicyclus sp. CXY001 TaxID=3242492 RepID=UPI0035709D0D